MSSEKKLESLKMGFQEQLAEMDPVREKLVSKVELVDALAADFVAEKELAVRQAVEGKDSELAAAKAELEQVPAKLEAAKAEAFQAGKAEGLVEGEQIGFEKGVAKAGEAGGSDKIYSQAELDEKLAPLAAQVADLQAKVDGFPAELAAAVGAKQAEMLADFEQAQMDDQAFIAKYKPQG